jgi:hypothetical protein
MDKDGMHALHWQPENNRWTEVGWDDFLAFRECFVPFKPLLGLTAGVHHFVVCVCGEGQTFNIIPHKYLVEPNGKIGRDNFYGWNREEREDFNRLMLASEHKHGEEERLREIQKKGGKAMYPPKESLYSLVLALPFPPTKDCAAMDFLDRVAADVY